MEIELIEIRDFLAERSPFNALSEQRLDALTKMLSIRYLRRNKAFPPSDAEANYLYIVRSGAVDLLDEKDNLIQKLDVGDIYTRPCQLIDIGGASKGLSAEDTLLYLLPCTQLQELRSQEPEFDQHFSASIRERLKLALDTMQNISNQASMAPMTTKVEDLITKPPVLASADISIREAARTMKENNVSSLMLLENGRLSGMITDSDIRSRCVANGLSADGSVRSIMSSGLESVQKNALVLTALMKMTQHHFHHLPVLDGAKVVGMLTANDITRQQAAHSAYIATDIRKANSLEELVNISSRLPALQFQLANSSATALHIGEAVSSITDSLTVRLLEMAEQELGPPPVPYVWLTGGSQARREQSSHSDQDNAMIIADELRPEQESWFANLANRVCDGLNDCGFIYCPGNAMAANPKWRQPLRVWRRYFHEWIETPQPMALMFSSIFFDLRPVYGEADLFDSLQGEILGITKGNGIFTAYMVSNALQFRPPLGFFRTFVLIHGGDHDDTLDIKHRGIVPITDIARILALSQGLPQINTTERLLAAETTNALSTEMGENLVDALEFIASLRITHQAGQIRKGMSPDNYLPPDELSELERKHLKDAFSVIQNMQNILESRYQSGRFR